MYASKNYKTKAELKRDLATGKRVTFYQPNAIHPWEHLLQGEHKVYLEGPWYPAPHKWYAEAWAKDGAIVKVR